MTTNKREFPRSWRWDENGDTISGVLVGLRWVQSKQNDEKVPVITLQANGEQISVWLSGSLKRRMDDEAPRYGDTMRIERGALVPFGNEGRTYREWNIVLERATGSHADLAGGGLPASYEPSSPADAPIASASDDSDIPF